MNFLKKHTVIVEFIEKSNNQYYPVEAIYEGSPDRCAELQKLGFLGDEVKEPKKEQQPPVNDNGKDKGKGKEEKVPDPEAGGNSEPEK